MYRTTVSGKGNKWHNGILDIKQKEVDWNVAPNAGHKSKILDMLETWHKGQKQKKIWIQEKRL